MYCTNCGKEVHEKAVACPACGVPPRHERKFCNACGTPTEPGRTSCAKCGVSTLPAGTKDKVAAGLLGIFLGSIGIHKFYLGYTTEGLIMLLGTLIGSFITCGASAGVLGIIGLVEGIIYLTKDEGEFHRIYVANKRGWF